ncbi:Tripartite ATP-independent periplasmic transporters, DctQ component [Aquimixticola soesokkakensis]|uniref:TRAP transporter small permease protein n=1 Tax=Aquimixticola soesokkakensis TaxID=1519096 RepID=A0A1Y5TLF2_9RHOB|nr:TRAP transporter small permease subunit [Aquimixticola soesokkakensis]SLN66311.1 Tripartite ATP-independent periplasmic transporters, DctQ component [Aquimixticola soesokkakensis]
MDRIKTIAGWLQRRAENILALVLGALFLSFLIQIVFRYLLDLPLGWTVEFVAIAWLFGILFGYAFVVHESDVIRLDIIYAALPSPARRALDVITGLICAGIFLYTLPAVIGFVQFMSIEKTAYMKIPFDWVFAIYIPFALSVIIRSLYTVYIGIRGSGPAFDTPTSAGTHDYD